MFLKRKARRSALAGLLLMVLGGIISACAGRQAALTPPEDFGDGVLILTNRSGLAVQRIWMAPSSAPLADGVQPEGDFASRPCVSPRSVGAACALPVLPGQFFETVVPQGEWTLWVEAENGADVVIEQLWFDGERPQVLEILDVWWVQGDWLNEERLRETTAP